MRHLSKVVWSEGMHLAQHHFQTQTRYFEDAIHFALSQLFVSPYGVAALELDGEAIRNATVAVVHARGVMPDGLPFHIPDADPGPPSLAIADRFSPVRDSQLVMLAITARRDDGMNTGVESNGSATRFTAEESTVVDEITGRDAARVDVARKNFVLVLDDGIPEGAVALPIARVRRDGAGRFEYDETYIPPCLQIGASAALMRQLGRLVETLDAKSDALGGGRAADRENVGQLATHDVASYWLLHAVHAAVVPLRHHLRARRTRPEELFVEMSRLAGALCTFALDAHPRALPAYDHDALAESFGALDRHIRAHLETVIPTSYVRIPLKAPVSFISTGTVHDPRCFGRSKWVLGIRARMGDGDLIANVPRLVKFCSAKFTPELVRRAFPGLTLAHLPVPPASIAPKLGTQYFAVSTAGPCWDTLVQTHEVGVYVPDAFPDAELDLVILVDA
ncbi:MAG: type VI secretion system baseplate subunit TssK [Gemmatimonadaceae bacterium]